MCDVKGCRRETAFIYYNFAVCEKHWEAHCDGKINLKKIFNIPEEKLTDNQGNKTLDFYNFPTNPQSSV